MPGAYLKGNISFPSSAFSVDTVSRAWNYSGSLDTIISNTSDFTADSNCRVDYYKLENIIILSVTAFLKPSTFRYLGANDQTSYVYTGDFEFPDKIVTEANVQLDKKLSCATHHFQTAITVEDFKTGVFFDLSRDYRLATMHINGVLDTTKLVITLPSGFLPNHEYNVSGELIYEVL
jgi:hypothetical protein